MTAETTPLLANQKSGEQSQTDNAQDYPHDDTSAAQQEEALYTPAASAGANEDLQAKHKDSKEQRSVRFNLTNTSAQLAASDTAHTQRELWQSNAPVDAEAKLAVGRFPNTTDGSKAPHVESELRNTSETIT